jgi:H+/Cl- antiporter ClcA
LDFGVTQALNSNPFAVIRTRKYAVLLVLGALLGIPISAVAYFFLALVAHIQTWVYEDLPKSLGLGSSPTWWPLIPLGVAGLLVGWIIRDLPGRGGHSPADGFKAGPSATPAMLPGVFLAAVVSLGLGAVIGPEAPLIALGGGVAIWIVLLVKKDSPQQAIMLISAAGSFAAVSALLGSPLFGAFLLMEAIGISGAMGTLILMPGLLASGIGALIFIGLDSLTGLGSVSLALPGLPDFKEPTGKEFLWAIAIGVIAAALGAGIRRLGLLIRPILEKGLVIRTPIAGIAVALLAIVYALTTGKPTTDVLFSGQSFLPTLISERADYAWGALLALILLKALAYGVSLAGFRGGPVFPAMFIGGAIGLLLSSVTSLALAPAIGMGIGAMCAAMLRLPLTSVLLATLLLAQDGLAVMPVVIVAVVVAYMTSIWIAPTPAQAPAPEPATPGTTAAGATPATPPPGTGRDPVTGLRSP